jgi:hypothetical protein
VYLLASSSQNKNDNNTMLFMVLKTQNPATISKKNKNKEVELHTLFQKELIHFITGFNMLKVFS